MKNIAILTSGGDAPGMNASIRASVRYAIYEGMTIFGIEYGYQGLLEGRITELCMRSVSDTLQRGGTKLKTSRCKDFATEEGQNRAVEILKERGIEGLIVIGGDGSFRGARALSLKGIKTVGIPGTIDNDLAYTDYTLGFDTACNTAIDAINKIRDTIASHDRVNVVEVMGRHCGDLALYAGIGGGAEVVLVPEFEFDIEQICQTLRKTKQLGKNSAIVVLAEGAGRAQDIASQIEALSGLGVRSTVLGYLQRGGSPSMFDRLLGTQMGVHAVKLLRDDIGNRVVGIRDNKIFDMDIFDALQMKKNADLELYKICNIVSR